MTLTKQDVINIIQIRSRSINQDIEAHSCNPSYLRGSGWRIEVLSQPGKIVHETP
jgi:hypothetical protein